MCCVLVIECDCWVVELVKVVNGYSYLMFIFMFNDEFGLFLGGMLGCELCYMKDRGGFKLLFFLIMLIVVVLVVSLVFVLLLVWYFLYLIWYFKNVFN